MENPAEINSMKKCRLKKRHFFGNSELCELSNVFLFRTDMEKNSFPFVAGAGNNLCDLIV